MMIRIILCNILKLIVVSGNFDLVLVCFLLDLNHFLNKNRPEFKTRFVEID